MNAGFGVKNDFKMLRASLPQSSAFLSILRVVDYVDVGSYV